MIKLKSRVRALYTAVALAMVLFGVLPAWAAEAPAKLKIIVLPFEVNADPGLEYLKDSLPELIRDHLVDIGFSVVPHAEVLKLIEEEGVEYLDLAAARDLALLAGANYALYGSFNQIGEGLSLDARLVEAFGLKPAKPLFVVREGLINVLPAVFDLSEKVRLELLRKERIVALEVQGTKVLEKDVVLMRIRVQKGDTYDPRVVDEELKRIFELGYFDDVRVRVDDLPDGMRLTFVVEEKPRIQTVGILGAEELDEDDILEVMNTKSGSVLNPKVLSEDLGKIRELYRKEGYYKAEVTYALEQTDPTQARLNIVVKEGDKMFIKKIVIQGSEQLDEDDLKDELALSERGFFSWVSGSGVLKEELLNRDAAALEAYYGNRGFVESKVGRPEVEFKEDGIYITFKVDEGARYKAGEVSFAGDILEDTGKLAEITKLDDLAADEEYFDRSVLREDSQALAEYYTNYGYAFAEADYLLDVNATSRTVDVVYTLHKRQKIYIRGVTIEGNYKTRDNVIRRELRLLDGDLFNGSLLRRSNERLNKKAFFEQADIETVPTLSENELDLKVKVKEQSTGQLSAGVGYSSFARFFLSASASERNLFGKGYYLGLTGSWSGKFSRYNLSFTNPHFNDSPLSVGGDVYYWLDDLGDYSKDTQGARARFGYPIGEYTRVNWHYRLDRYEISGVDSDAADEIKDIEGENWASAALAGVTRDTTDRRLNPTKGGVNQLSLEYAGGLLMGDDEFIKSIADSSWYYPLWWSHVFHWHGQAGYVMENFGGDEVPVFERFYLGGINSVRGYTGARISPYDDESGDRIGGNKEFFTNFEYIFPLFKDVGLMGLGFFDAGDVWDDGETMDFDLKKSVGGGVRWYSPMGPLRLEYGYALDDIRNQGARGKLEFTIGQFF